MARTGDGCLPWVLQKAVLLPDRALFTFTGTEITKFEMNRCLKAADGFPFKSP